MVCGGAPSLDLELLTVQLWQQSVLHMLALAAAQLLQAWQDTCTQLQYPPSHSTQWCYRAALRVQQTKSLCTCATFASQPASLAMVISLLLP